jgi:hypothetical protein
LPSNEDRTSTKTEVTETTKGVDLINPEVVNVSAEKPLQEESQITSREHMLMGPNGLRLLGPNSRPNGLVPGIVESRRSCPDLVKFADEINVQTFEILGVTDVKAYALISLSKSSDRVAKLSRFSDECMAQISRQGTSTEWCALRLYFGCNQAISTLDECWNLGIGNRRDDGTIFTDATLISVHFEALDVVVLSGETLTDVGFVVASCPYSLCFYAPSSLFCHAFFQTCSTT